MLFTSTWDEPYGLTLAESLACGTPVIGFDVGASAEIVTPSTGVIVAKEDKDAFIKGFTKIQSISRQACRERALQFCSVAAMVAGYLDLYKAAVAESEQKKIQQKKDVEAPTVAHLKLNPFIHRNGKSNKAESIIGSSSSLNNIMERG